MMILRTLFLCLSVIAISSAIDDEEAGRLVVVKSGEATVHLRIIGDLNDKKNIPIICLPGSNPSLKGTV
jgi:hypothetical protein